MTICLVVTIAMHRLMTYKIWWPIAKVNAPLLRHMMYHVFTYNVYIKLGHFTNIFY